MIDLAGSPPYTTESTTADMRCCAACDVDWSDGAHRCWVCHSPGRHGNVDTLRRTLSREQIPRPTRYAADYRGTFD
jgi:predicted amidophosphoribosyltransferase